MSGNSDKRVSKLLAEHSDCAFLQKPFEAEELLKQINELVG